MAESALRDAAVNLLNHLGSRVPGYVIQDYGVTERMDALRRALFPPVPRVQVRVSFIDPDAVVGGDPNPKVEHHDCTVPESVLCAFLDEWEGT